VSGDERRRGPRNPSSESSMPGRTRATRRECYAWAGGRTGPATRRRATSWSRRRRWDAIAVTFEAPRGRRRRAADRVPRGRAGRRRDSAGSSRRLPSSSATAATGQLSDVLVDLPSTTTSARSQSSRACTAPRRDLRQDGREHWVEVDEGLAAELTSRLGGWLRRQLAGPFFRWAGTRIWRSASTASADRPRRARGAARR